MSSLEGGFMQARRAELARATDAKSLATRHRLTAALRDLLERGEDLSVAAVCREAGIARSTFYTHFASIEDVGVGAVGDIFAEQSPADRERRRHDVLDREQATRIGLRGLLTDIAAARPLVRGVLRLGSGVMAGRIVDEVARSMRSPILAERPDLDPETLAVASRYISAGLVAVLDQWLDDENPDVDRLTDQLYELLPRFLTTD